MKSIEGACLSSQGGWAMITKGVTWGMIRRRYDRSKAACEWRVGWYSPPEVKALITEAVINDCRRRDSRPPEEDDEPGGDIDWGDGNPLDQ